MSEWDAPKEDLSHPDSAIRLASCVHRFRVPTMNPVRDISFARAFRTTGRNEKTRKVVLKADDARKKLHEATSADKVSHERVVLEAKKYQPFIHQILVSCKFQPEVARLDERLVFEWSSGVENEKKKFFKSEALMYDLVMCIACEGLGKAGVATEASVAGEFAIASREYAAAAGIFGFLADDQLPTWIARGSSVDGNELPVECTVAVADGLRRLFMANGQQMAVATLLIKAGTPNYSLVAKLCLGIVEQLEEFVRRMREDCFKCMSRIDKDFFTLVTFQIQVHKSLSLYFYAKSLWEQQSEYGLAIAFLSEATVALKTRASSTSEGVPDVYSMKALSVLGKDLKDLRDHMALVLRRWEKDNSSVYFESVPQSVPEDKKLKSGIQMKKSEKYSIGDVEPVLLEIPEGSLQRSDSDLARELQEQLNAGGD